MTKVESIVMQNFYNYRDYIQYDFKEGLNVIVADNNGGKSKLYNAFNWILSDRVFDSDTRQYYDVTNSNKVGLFKMISDKAKSVSNVDETINTKVELIFSNFLNPGNPKTYRIVKQIKAVKKIVEAPFDPQSWQIELLPIECFHEDILESKPVAGDSIIGKLFPDALKHYFLFQGEEVDKLIGKELTNAVREIHGTWMYDYMGLFLKDLLEKSENDFRKYNTSFSTNTKKAQNLNNEIDHLKKLIEEKKDDISSHNEKLENLREKLTLSEEEIAEYQKQSSIKSQLASVHAKINESSDRISNFEMKYNEHFFSSKWLLLGFDKYEAKFNQLRKAYKDWKTAEKVKEEIEIFTTDLPFGSPGLPELRLMLEEMKCFVCDRKIDNGSHSYEHIQKLIDHYTPKPKAAEPEDHIEEFFDELFKSFNELPKEREVEQEKRALVSTYEKMNENLKQYSNKARELEQNQKMDFEEFKKKWDDHKYFSSEINNVKNRIEKAKDTIRNAEAECKKKESALSKLSTGTNPGYKNKYQLLDDINAAYVRTVNSKYMNLAAELENNINSIYSELTLNSDTNPGTVSVTVDDNKKFHSELKNAQGGLLTGQGTAFQRMKELSIVIGITMMKAKTGNSYPLIADAPVSEMGEILTNNFFYTVPKHFNQLIIFVKDLYQKESDVPKLNDFGKSLKESSVLRPRIYINYAEGKDQHDRNTKTLLVAEG